MNNGNTHHYDTIIVGAGPAGIFEALRLIQLIEEDNDKDFQILMIDVGKPFEERECPMESLGKCVQCKPCRKTAGFAGAGCKSDGKVHVYTRDQKEIITGGNLSKVVGLSRTIELSERVHDILDKYGARKKYYGLSNQAGVDNVRKLIETVPGMRMVKNAVRHIGTEHLRPVFLGMEQDLRNNPHVTLMFDTELIDLIIEDNHIKGIITSKGVFYADTVSLNMGRYGGIKFCQLAKKHGIKIRPGVIDLGVRVEVPNTVQNLAKACGEVYEFKAVYLTPSYQDEVRTFCMNYKGEVAPENVGGITYVNGHANGTIDKETDNTNFAILVSMSFTDVDEPMLYMDHIGKMANLLGGVIVQRLGDIRGHKRSWQEEIQNNSVKATMTSAKAGDLTLVYPYRIMLDILEMIEALAEAFPGMASDDTLLYGAEVKYYGTETEYANRDTLETNIEGLFAGGDSSGSTHGIVQAAGSGWAIAEGKYRKRK